MDNYVTVTEAAARLGCCRQRVHQWVGQGRLASKRVGKLIVIPVAGLSRPEKIAPGRKKLNASL